VLELNGMPDHVHLGIKLPSTISIARLLNVLKGTSSDFARDELQVWRRGEEGFGWQDNYAAFSLSYPDVTKAVAYVKNQKQRHTAGKVWAQWEETNEEVPGQ
jgi:REP element-mobilizing transposase RayT